MKLLQFILLFFIFTSPVYADESVTILSPNYFEEQGNTFEDINYLDNEHLTVQFCSDDKATQAEINLICNSNSQITKLNVEKDAREKNCYFTNYNLEKYSCSDFKLEISYNSENKKKKTERTFVRQIESNLLKHVLNSDYDTLSPIDLSYYIVVLGNSKGLEDEETVKAYEKLKNIRSNTNKCWPDVSCTIDETSEILANLKIATYPDSTRLLEDGKRYLEKETITNENTAQDFLIEFRDDILSDNVTTIGCTLTIDSDKEVEHELDDNSDNIDDERASESVSIECNETIEKMSFFLFDFQGRLQTDEKYINQTSFTFDLDAFACLGRSGTCDFSNTLNGLIAYSSLIENSALFLDFVQSRLIENKGEKYFNTDKLYEDGGKYLYYVGDTEISEFLKFRQNNDGSWGTGKITEKVEETAWAILGIEKNEKDTEYVEDGKKWIYYNEPILGWGDIKKNALAYLAIKEQIKPYIKISTTNKINGTTSFKLENPTIFDLKDIKFTFSEDISEYMVNSVNLGNLEPSEIINTNVSVSSSLTGIETGEIIITGLDINNERIELIRMPISIEGTFSITYAEQNYTLSDTETTVPLNFNVIGDVSSKCNFLDPFTDIVKNISFSSVVPVISLDNSELRKGDFNFDINCDVKGKELKIPVKFNVEILETVVDANVKEIVMDEFKDIKLDIVSLSSEVEEVSIEVTEVFDGILVPIEDEIVLQPGATKTVKFLIGDTTFLGYLEDDQMRGSVKLTTANGFEKKIPIVRSATISNNENTFDGNSSGSSTTQWIWIMVVIVVISFLAFLGFRYRQYQREEEIEEQEEQEDEIILE